MKVAVPVAAEPEPTDVPSMKNVTVPPPGLGNTVAVTVTEVAPYVAFVLEALVVVEIALV